ncbi:hypothetical protein HYH02_005925 [Chlamydomonas schloesseri]|uniref:Uncharacterized protein n=1 Tax=Chlamydomonas schloesseri TaxID=2026947 RepID=A0A835WKY0_9CHLO|nr:hypothetical protein HYH02_005925 [Chlamydomonas schloesseri]|eukprot:KAG2449178.1 hypothetical protein HYH02_005925 [Chlamydomonas schloesseri]
MEHQQQGGTTRSGSEAGGEAGSRGSLHLREVVEAEAPQLDDQSALQPHGEKLKRGPDSEETHETGPLYADMTTPQLHTTSLAEAVAGDRPLLDDQSTTPPHTASKAGHGLPGQQQQQQQQQQQ